MPFFDTIDPETVDLVLVTHFHLDHCASLPFFLQKTGFKGRVFMTPPTKAIYKMLMMDYARVSNVSAEDVLFDDQDVLKTMDKIDPVMEAEGGESPPEAEGADAPPETAPCRVRHM